MRKCPWCGRENLNVYAYCQSCGRGFDDPDPTGDVAKRGRSFLMIAVIASAALAVIAIASAALLLMGGDDEEPVAAQGEPQPTAAPAGPWDGAIVERNVLFVTTEFRLPPNTEVTLVEDNQDAQIPHNIRFFTTDEAGGDTLGGCIEGCDGDDLATPIRPGVAQNPFTFTTPGVGSYAYHCDVHPTTMVGTMIIEDGAPVPDAAQ